MIIWNLNILKLQYYLVILHCKLIKIPVLWLTKPLKLLIRIWSTD